MKKRTIALLLAVVMLFGATVGGTIAWLTAKTNEVNNTFVVGDIEIDLDEAEVINGVVTTPEKRVKANEYKMIPGATYFKDPTVHVLEGSEECYVFVEVIETNNTYNTDDKVIQYTVDTTNWELVETTTEGNVVTTVYMYKETLEAGESTESVLAITDEVSITVNCDVTKTELEAMDEGSTEPELDFVAYAIQKDNLTVTAAADIWALAKTATEVTPNP